MHMHPVACHVEAEFIALAMGEARLDPPASHPEGEGIRMMVPSPLLGVVDVALEKRRATEFAAPDDQRVVQQPALLEILHERGGGGIRILTLNLELGVQIAMLVPAGMHELDEPHATLGHPARHQAVVGEAALPHHVGAIHLQDVPRFIGEVGQIGHARLHSVGHLILRNAGGDLRVAELLEPHLIDLREAVQNAALHFAAHAFWIAEIQHGIAAAAELHALILRRKKSAAPVEVVKDLAA